MCGCRHLSLYDIQGMHMAHLAGRYGLLCVPPAAAASSASCSVVPRCITHTTSCKRRHTAQRVSYREECLHPSLSEPSYVSACISQGVSEKRQTQAHPLCLVPLGPSLQTAPDTSHTPSTVRRPVYTVRLRYREGTVRVLGESSPRSHHALLSRTHRIYMKHLTKSGVYTTFSVRETVCTRHLPYRQGCVRKDLTDPFRWPRPWRRPSAAVPSTC